MANFKKTQLLTLSLIATLLSFTPLLSTSFRSTYLYFIINVLIVVLGAQAGILSPPSSSSSTTSNKNQLEVDKKSATNNASAIVEEDIKAACREKLFVVENYVPEKILVCVDEVKKMIKKCPSTPSIFFIGGNDDEEEEKELIQEFEEEKEVSEDDEEELFVKAETFIVNFYKQLKMQREESWKNFREFNEKNGLIS